MGAYRYIRKLLLSGGFTFSLFFSSICGLRDAGILDDLGRSDYKAGLTSSPAGRQSRSLFSPGKWARQ